MENLEISCHEVETRNIVNTRADELQLALHAALTPFIGKKIIKGDAYRQWAVRVKGVIDDVESKCGIREDGFRICYSFFTNFVYCEIDKTYDMPLGYFKSGVKYVKQEFHVCRLDGDIMLPYDDDVISFRCDYTVEEVRRNEMRIKEMEEVISNIKSEMRDFYSVI